MTGLKLMGAAWFATIGSVPFVSPIVGNLTSASDGWAKGGPQVILALVVIGLSTAIGVTWNRLLGAHREKAVIQEQRVAEAKEYAHAQEQRVTEAKEYARQQVEHANRILEQTSELLSECSTALAQNADSNKELKESIYHLSSVVDKKLDKSV